MAMFRNTIIVAGILFSLCLTGCKEEKIINAPVVTATVTSYPVICPRGSQIATRLSTHTFQTYCFNPERKVMEGPCVSQGENFFIIGNYHNDKREGHEIHMDTERGQVMLILQFKDDIETGGSTTVPVLGTNQPKQKKNGLAHWAEGFM